MRSWFLPDAQKVVRLFGQAIRFDLFALTAAPIIFDDLACAVAPHWRRRPVGLAKPLASGSFPLIRCAREKISVRSTASATARRARRVFPPVLPALSAG
ncbi:hypothetical protein [Hoeflea poritis]|uniref:Uncharacterized protein n=1 Tax=Hoeflea poritis TaxID=2993659 RepID=A0ABT4VVY4_9HYPH|nr:hypothetical protein [Hoeflea poritis]MDA4848871.1 hypothetical protein [Hoeflea poritis]